MKTLTSLAALVATPKVFAHAGDHGSHIFATLGHLFSQPDHLVMAAAGVLAGLIAAVLVRRRA
ncbi:hypothetical protein [Litorivicinus lipolyticus]|uniref:hypothetical protein n=1 Tax=Litorivicinus lipolyticus TaxID=418701 RepID=UPI003B5CFEE6